MYQLLLHNNQPPLKVMLYTIVKVFLIPHKSEWFTDLGGGSGLGWAHSRDCSELLVGQDALLIHLPWVRSY